jgi:Na+:H+ antiporter, NhaA family
LVGFVLWLCVLKSGVHATLAGVVLALALPLDDKNNCLANRVISKLHPWVVYFVIPVFALANAGINLTEVSFNVLENHIALGVIFGLVLGKPIGILGFSWLAEIFNIAYRPKDISWTAMTALSLLCGIGFTMSLFLGTLAFDDYHLYNTVKVGVFLGSIIAGISGSIVLSYFKLKQ